MTRLTLLIAALSLLMLSSPSSFAGESENTHPTDATVLKGYVGAISGFAAFRWARIASKETKRLAALKTATNIAESKYNTIMINGLRSDTRLLEKPGIKDAQAKLEKLEEEYRTLYWKLVDAKNGKSNTAGQLNIQESEKRLAQINQEVTEIKKWFPTELVNRSRARLENLSKLTTKSFYPDRRVFSEAEAASLIAAHQDIQTVLNDSVETEKLLLKSRSSGRFLAAVGGVLSVGSLGSAISDLTEKKASATLSEGYTPAQQQPSSTASALK